MSRWVLSSSHPHLLYFTFNGWLMYNDKQARAQEKKKPQALSNAEAIPERTGRAGSRTSLYHYVGRVRKQYASMSDREKAEQESH